MALNTPYAFIIRVKNKIHIVHIACLLQLKYMRVRQSKFTKTNTKICSNEGGGVQCAGPGSAFELYRLIWLLPFSTSSQDPAVHVEI